MFADKEQPDGTIVEESAVWEVRDQLVYFQILSYTNSL